MAWQDLVAAGVGLAVLPKLTLPTARVDIAVRELDAPSLIRQSVWPRHPAATDRRPPMR